MDEFFQWLKKEKDRFKNLNLATCQKIRKKEQLDMINRMIVKLKSVIKERDHYVKTVYGNAVESQRKRKD